MIRDEAFIYLNAMFDLIGTTAVEYWTSIDADRMKKAASILYDLSIEDLKEEATMRGLILSKKEETNENTGHHDSTFVGSGRGNEKPI